MYAAHLYDAVLLYARALGATLREHNLTDPYNITEAAKDGKSLFKHIIRDRKYESEFFYFKSYFLHESYLFYRLNTLYSIVWICFSFRFRSGVTGASIRIDDNGDSEGNYTVLAVKFSNVSRAININKMGDSRFYCHYEMMPVGRFDYTNNTTPVFGIWRRFTCRLPQQKCILRRNSP